ncbi:ABC-2 transporter permease [Clostridium oryzae]|uniref:ABC-2 family transporter protein n=1 Tax=Clostridium oryzae TaxID=1450648 RepID=A0A1V4IDK1_9CLOT|nr:ABC-2 transporter permease [Clostridium oryzae]OPJ57725.1 hypothetical protein CLORY_39530 [Clostridium oryzae]
MMGLLLKDLINLKKNFMISSLAIVYVFFQCIFYKDTSMFNMMIVLILIFAPMISISYDERSNWDRYALSMPLSKTDIVTSKYILGILLNAIAFIINMIFNLMGTSIGLHSNYLLALTFTSAGILFIAVYLPIIFKFDSEKGRYIFLIIYIMPFILGYLMFKNNIMPSHQTINVLLVMFPFISLAAYVISAGISITIYSKKEQ